MTDDLHTSHDDSADADLALRGSAAPAHAAHDSPATAEGATEGTIFDTTREPPAFQPSYAGAVGEDGCFADGWTSRAFGPDYNGPLRGVRGVTELDKLLRDNMAAARSRQGPPDERSTPDQIAAWRRALGVPSTPDDYGDLRPRNVPPEMWDEESAAVLKGIAHKHHIPPRALSDILGLYAVQLDAQMKSMETGMQTYIATQTQQLRTEWRDEYDTQVRHAARFAAMIGLDPRLPELQSAPIVKALARGARLLSEDHVVGGRHGGLSSSPRDQAQAIMTDKSNPHYEAYQRGDSEAVALVNNLLLAAAR